MCSDISWYMSNSVRHVGFSGAFLGGWQIGRGNGKLGAHQAGPYSEGFHHGNLS